MIDSTNNRRKGYFLRLFCSAIDDPTLARLDDKVFRFYIYLQLIAKEGASDGRIENNLDEISWRMRWQKPDAERCMNALIEHGFVIRDNGVFVISGWNESQYCDSYERVKRFRNAKKAEGCNAVCNGSVTTEKEIEKETDTDGEAEAEREPESVTRKETGRVSKAEHGMAVETDEETDFEKETDTEKDIIYRFTGSKNPFEENDNGHNPDATTGYPSQYLFRRFQEEFPLCSWTPDNVMDVIRNKILASKLWTVQEVEQAIRYLAKHSPKKNATPRQLVSYLQSLTENNNTEKARQARRAKMIAQKKEEERILRENEEWRKIHGKREPGQALREIQALLEQESGKTHL